MSFCEQASLYGRRKKIGSSGFWGPLEEGGFGARPQLSVKKLSLFLLCKITIKHFNLCSTLSGDVEYMTLTVYSDLAQLRLRKGGGAKNLISISNQINFFRKRPQFLTLFDSFFSGRFACAKVKFAVFREAKYSKFNFTTRKS